MSRTPLPRHLLAGSGLIFAGLIDCQLTCTALDQRIDEDGNLRQPFFLILISGLLLLGSTVLLAGAGVARLKGEGTY